MSITLKINTPITTESFIAVLKASGLAERRPIDNVECMEGMLKHANLTVTAWDGEKLIGVARSVTDFHYCCYLSDIAVDKGYQKQGIGKKLIAATKQQLKSTSKLVLLSAPDAVKYYPHIGFESHPHAWMLRSDQEVK